MHFLHSYWSINFRSRTKGPTGLQSFVILYCPSSHGLKGFCYLGGTKVLRLSPTRTRDMCLSWKFKSSQILGHDTTLLRNFVNYSHSTRHTPPLWEPQTSHMSVSVWLVLGRGFMTGRKVEPSIEKHNSDSTFKKWTSLACDTVLISRETGR